jgi:formyl-CoA transferase
MHLVIGILAALQQRHGTGRGQHVEVSMQDAVVNLCRVSLRDHQRLGHAMPRTGNQLGRNVPGTIYPCHPGGPNDYVFIFAQPQMWLAFLEVLGLPALAEDERFATLEARWENRVALDAIISEWTALRDKQGVMAAMGAAGVPCGAVQDTGEVLADPHLKAREMIVDLDYGQRGTYQTVGCPIKLSASPAEITRPPELGEHTDDVLRDILQIDAGEVARLRRENVI